MSKIVLVETVSTFRHIYAVELPDNVPNEYALDDVTLNIGSDEPEFEEFGQEHIGETILSHRVIDEKEYLRIFDEVSSYLSEWTDEEKKRFIFKSETLPNES
jgi:hypothetical protein